MTSLWNFLVGKSHNGLLDTLKKREYSHTDIMNTCSMKSREVIYMNESGTISPAASKARGCTTKRRYSFYNIIDFQVIKAFRSNGIEYKKIKDIMDLSKTFMETYGFGYEDVDSIALINGGSVLVSSHKNSEDICATGMLDDVLAVYPIPAITVSKTEVNVKHIFNSALEEVKDYVQ